MTLKEIAKEANVSISTVSRVINQHSTTVARKEVRDAIWNIARRGGYPTNKSSTGPLPQLDQSSFRSIACMFARTPESVSDPFFSTLARSIEDAAFSNHYSVRYTFTSIDIKQPSTTQILADNQIEGVVILGRCDKGLLRLLEQSCSYMIYTGLNPLDAQCDQVICDGAVAGHAAVRHLIDLGHQKIGYIGETTKENRFTGYCNALQENGLAVDQNYFVNVPLSSESGYLGAQKLLRQANDVTAIFCSNDVTAIGAIKALQEDGRKIPKDISVISIDDIEISQFLTPALTTVHIPIVEMGQMAAKMLIDRMNNGHQLPLKISLPFFIQERESCAKPHQ